MFANGENGKIYSVRHDYKWYSDIFALFGISSMPRRTRVSPAVLKVGQIDLTKPLENRWSEVSKGTGNIFIFENVPRQPRRSYLEADRRVLEKMMLDAVSDKDISPENMEKMLEGIGSPVAIRPLESSHKMISARVHDIKEDSNYIEELAIYYHELGHILVRPHKKIFDYDYARRSEVIADFFSTIIVGFGLKNYKLIKKVINLREGDLTNFLLDRVHQTSDELKVLDKLIPKNAWLKGFDTPEDLMQFALDVCLEVDNLDGDWEAVVKKGVGAILTVKPIDSQLALEEAFGGGF